MDEYTVTLKIKLMHDYHAPPSEWDWTTLLDLATADGESVEVLDETVDNDGALG